MKAYLTAQVLEAMDRGDAERVEDCFSTEPDLAVFVEHLTRTKNYAMLPSLLPFLCKKGKSKQIVDLFLPLLSELACDSDPSSQYLLQNLADNIGISSEDICHKLGLRGIAWDAIKIDKKEGRRYCRGVLEGRHFSLFDQNKELVAEHRVYLLRRARKHANEEAMDYFGYTDDTLALYFDFHFSKLLDCLFDGTKVVTIRCEEAQKLFEICRRKEANYLPFANRFLNRFYKIYKPFCRYLVKIGAKFDASEIQEVYLGDGGLYNFYFGEDV